MWLGGWVVSVQPFVLSPDKVLPSFPPLGPGLSWKQLSPASHFSPELLRLTQTPTECLTTET